MGNLLNAEVFKTVKRPVTWIMLAILAVIVIAFYLIVFLTVDNRATNESLRPDAIINNGFAIGSGIASILVIVMAAQLMGSEYGWGTLRALVSRASGRTPLIIAKLIVLTGYTLLTLLVTAGVSLLAAFVFSTIGDNVVSMSGSDWSDIAAGIGRNMLSSAVYAVLALVITILSKSTAAGIAGGIALSFLELAIFGILASISDTFDRIQEYFLAWNVQGLSAAGTEGAIDGFSVTRGVIIVGLWLIGLLAITIYVFRRRDITSG